VRRSQEDGLSARFAVTVAPPAIPVQFAHVPKFDKEKAVLKKNQSTAPDPWVPAKQNNSQSTAPARRAHIPMAAVMLLGLSSIAAGASINFSTDPFEGTNVRNIPGRQVVGGELFIAFHTATESFVFDGAAFGLGNQIHFANGLFNAIPATGDNAVVLQSTDNDANPLTPFGAANAADLLASQITDRGPGVFVYFNSGLNLARLVYSDDLSSNTADLRILARMLNLTGRDGINSLPSFSASNFDNFPIASCPGAIRRCVDVRGDRPIDPPHCSASARCSIADKWHNKLDEIRTNRWTMNNLKNIRGVD
jgi:hypothetical protein